MTADAQIEALNLRIVELQKQIAALLIELDARDAVKPAEPIGPEECAGFVVLSRGLKNLGEFLDPSQNWNPSTIKWWTKRGVPPAVQLKYLDKFITLRAIVLKEMRTLALGQK